MPRLGWKRFLKDPVERRPTRSRMRSLISLRVGQLFLSSERAAELYVDEVLDGSGRLLHLDSTGSVSGLELERDRHMWLSDQQLLEQCERFHNGS